MSTWYICLFNQFKVSGKYDNRRTSEFPEHEFTEVYWTKGFSVLKSKHWEMIQSVFCFTNTICHLGQIRALE